MDAKSVTAAAYAAETMDAETECVHVHADGTCTTGTDGRSTQPTAGWGSVVTTYHPDRAEDPWDCFEAAKEGEGEGDEEPTTMCTCADVWGGDGGGPCGHDAEDCFVRYVPEYQRSTAMAAGTRRGVWEKVEVSCACWSAIADGIERGDLEDEWYEALPLV